MDPKYFETSDIYKFCEWGEIIGWTYGSHVF